MCVLVLNNLEGVIKWRRRADEEQVYILITVVVMVAGCRCAVEYASACRSRYGCGSGGCCWAMLQVLAVEPLYRQ